jgi:hypothetical protein
LFGHTSSFISQDIFVSCGLKNKPSQVQGRGIRGTTLLGCKNQPAFSNGLVMIGGWLRG